MNHSDTFMNHIPTELYQKIHEMLPIACADIVLKHNNSFLLGKRTNKPARGEWFLLGGRIFKGEKLEDAAQRKIQEETGTKATIKRMLGVDETMFHDGPFGGPTHTINVVFLATPVDSPDPVALDDQNSEYRWFSEIDDSWHPYVKKFLTLAGFK